MFFEASATAPYQIRRIEELNKVNKMLYHHCFMLKCQLLLKQDVNIAFMTVPQSQITLSVDKRSSSKLPYEGSTRQKDALGFDNVLGHSCLYLSGHRNRILEKKLRLPGRENNHVGVIHRITIFRQSIIESTCCCCFRYILDVAMVESSCLIELDYSLVVIQRTRK